MSAVIVQASFRSLRELSARSLKISSSGKVVVSCFPGCRLLTFTSLWLACKPPAYLPASDGLDHIKLTGPQCQICLIGLMCSIYNHLQLNLERSRTGAHLVGAREEK